MALTDTSSFVQQLYVSYYGRPADSDGLAYWTARTEAEGREAIVDAFGSSREFQDDYGELSDEALVTTLFQQAFGREPDEEGLAYYTDVLASNEKSLAQIAYAITAGAEGDDKEVLGARVAAATDYTVSLPGPDYVTPHAQRLVASIDAKDTQTVLDEVREAIDQRVVALAHQKVLDQRDRLENAQDELYDAKYDLADKAVEFDIYTRDNPDGSFVDDAQDKLDDARMALADARAETSDAAVNDALDDALDAARDDPETAALLDEREAAREAVQDNITEAGSSRALAKDLDLAIARYFNKSPDLEGDVLGTLEDVAWSYYNGNIDAPTEKEFLMAVAIAEDAIFAGDDGESLLDEGERGDGLEALVTLLDQRNDLFAARDAAEADIQKTPEGKAVYEAEQALADREALKSAVSDAEDIVEAITGIENDRDEDLARLNAIEADFDYQVEPIDSAQGNDGLDDDTPVLFEYNVRIDESSDEAVTDAEIVNFGKDDLLALDRVFYAYRQGEVIDADGDGQARTIKGNDKASEVFFRQSADGEDAEVLVENARYPDGSERGNIYTITLTGVNADELVYGGGAISLGEIA